MNALEANALEYLKSLGPDTVIELPDTGEPQTLEGLAVETLTGSHPRDFAIRFNQWEWNAADLLAQLRADLTCP